MNLSETPIRVEPNQTILIQWLVFTSPYGTDTLKVFATKELFDVNLFINSLATQAHPAKPLLPDSDWGVVDLVVETHGKPAR